MFEDPQCPYCQQWTLDTLPTVVDEFVRTGRLTLVYRGIEVIGPNSEKGLRAVFAAGRQNKLWNFSSALYDMQGAENSGWITDDVIRSAAAAAGADGAAILATSSSNEVSAQLALAEREAQHLPGPGHADLRARTAAGAPDPARGDEPRARPVHGGALGRPAVTGVRAAVLALSIVGAAIAAYLTYVHYAHVAPICTTGGLRAGAAVELRHDRRCAGCIARAARLLRDRRHRAPPRASTAAVVGVVLALGGAAFSGYLLWAQLGPIGAICQWCLGNDAVIAGIALLSVARLLTEPD